MSYSFDTYGHIHKLFTRTFKEFPILPYEVPRLSGISSMSKASDFVSLPFKGSVFVQSFLGQLVQPQFCSHLQVPELAQLQAPAELQLQAIV